MSFQPELLQMVDGKLLSLSQVRKRTSDPSILEWLVSMEQLLASHDIADSPRSSRPKHPLVRRLRLEANLSLRPIADILKTWYILDEATSTLVHRHCTAAFWPHPKDDFCLCCGKTFIENMPEPEDNPPNEERISLGLDPNYWRPNPRCLACWFGYFEAERYFDVIMGLWRPLLLQTTAISEDLFEFAGAELELVVDEDIYGSTFGYLSVKPLLGVTPRSWAESNGIPVVTEAVLCVF